MIIAQNNIYKSQRDNILVIVIADNNNKNEYGRKTTGSANAVLCKLFFIAFTPSYAIIILAWPRPKSLTMSR